MVVQTLMAERRLDHILNQVGKYPQTGILFVVICVLLMSGHIDAMLWCTETLLVYKHAQVDSIAENRQQQ
jgi:hypothetical protein